MRHSRWLLVLLIIGIVLTGCGTERTKGVNEDKDRPKSSGK